MRLAGRKLDLVGGRQVDLRREGRIANHGLKRRLTRVACIAKGRGDLGSCLERANDVAEATMGQSPPLPTRVSRQVLWKNTAVREG